MKNIITIHKRDELFNFSPPDNSSASQPYLIRIDIPDLKPEEIVNLVLKYEDIAELWIRTASLSSVSKNLWLKFNRNHKNSYYLKRITDIIIGLALLIVSLPVFLLVSILVRMSSKNSIIFQQPRISGDLKLFNFYKFRTMSNGSENSDIHQIYMCNNIRNSNPNQKVHKIVDDPRITKIGKWLRRLSIDELPQLINILKGEMSLVGPRPPIPYEVKEYADWHYARFKAKPGLTGLWQVRGRSFISFDEMVLLDLYYAYNQSIWMDFKILLQTIPSVLSIKGAF